MSVLLSSGLGLYHWGKAYWPVSNSYASICGVLPVYTTLWIRLVFLQRPIKSNLKFSMSLFVRRSLIPNFIISKNATLSMTFTQKKRGYVMKVCVDTKLWRTLCIHTPPFKLYWKPSRLTTLTESSLTHPTQIRWRHRENKQIEALTHKMRRLWENKRMETKNVCIPAEVKWR